MSRGTGNPTYARPGSTVARRRGHADDVLRDLHEYGVSRGRTTPARVPCAVAVGDAERSTSGSAPAIALARPKSRTFDGTLRSQLDVCRLEVTVDDSAIVRRVQCLSHVLRDRQSLGRR